MKKKLLYFLLILILSISCSENKNKSPNASSKQESQIENTRKANDYPSSQFFVQNNSKLINSMESISGISTNPSIIIQKGILEVNLREGNLSTDTNENIKLIKNNQINGVLNLKHAVTNAIINGTTDIVQADKIVFVPDEPLHPSIVYDLVFTEEETNNIYRERIFIAGANRCDPSGYFSRVPVNGTEKNNGQIVNLALKENVYLDKSLGNIAIVGWDHLISNSFYFRINNRTPGAKYKIIAAYGAYDIPGHECELYFQRDIKSPFPTWVDNNYGSKTTKVTDEDATIHNPNTKKFYHFTKTYLVIKVFNSSNVDITATDTAELSLEQTNSLYGLPISFTSEEESSLLAYLNRGNNNSYSVALGGLILGIFGFFISRRLFGKKEDNE
jgi:hypothetical protein